ncbi:type II secretion system protein [Cellulomonas sp. SG140]|uniref:type II secretion system protein n=1 Tax=Cellulomonas sp. SG140 TaxID=2976536 RepID=UPI0021E8F667|nr:prepilin-type N-terminal cleavage/methylation domain-containing protein [Cellulomonas sp. SG140]
MIARIRKSLREKDQGFTLIELLVVMIIIGILAAIAIPIFLNQRKKAQDSAATSDISTLGKEIATYYVDATGPLSVQTGSVALVSGRYQVNSVDVGKASSITPVVTYKEPSATDTVADSTGWCVQITYSGGTQTVVSYSAQNGLVKGTACP